MKNVHICSHPFLQHRLTILRDKRTSYPLFRRTLIECGALMSCELGRHFAMETVSIETPLEEMQSPRMQTRVTFVVILRAALGFVDGLTHFLPEAKIGHIGMYRDERTLEPVSYYQKLPGDITSTTVVLADPMLATGGSLLAAMKRLAEIGCRRNIMVACLLAAPEGVQAFHGEYPEIPIYTAALDRQLNSNGYILPGLGDAGDRQYGTD